MSAIKRCLDYCLIGGLLAILCAAGCAKRDRRRQSELESFAAGTLQRFLSLRESSSGIQPITNVAQVFAGMDLTRVHRGHPYVLQEKFREFGASAGFTNSIYEKYVVLAPGLTNHAIKGEMILMSARPFPDLDGRLIRIVIWRAGAEDYRSTEIAEGRIQEIFQEMNRPIPAPVPMPPPDPPPDLALYTSPISQRIELYFRDIAGDIGIGRSSWWILLLLMGLAVVTVGSTLILLMINRRRK